MQLGSTFSEQKTAFVERVQELQQLTTAEAYTKVLVKRTDNKLFGQSISVNFPGTKRNLLVVMPGSIKAGIDLSKITEQDVLESAEQNVVKTLKDMFSFAGYRLDIEFKE
ncbi:DUF4230 domain-containing protein [Sporosarcina ureae]|uniref:DUF4230 domain-containing protein n=1 Tax=Sporosarcina ureae TaxID=1571 RepID=UPI0009DC6FBB|nr:DUF4230 domain-containing protein [Sporosarcina ureae]ARF17921.1 hypothetical protein SporoP17a_11935 [Sporosarcina ureae]